MIARWRHSTWAIPILLALASVVGLVSALTGDGPRDWIAWVALGLPVAATLGAIGTGRSS